MMIECCLVPNKELLLIFYDPSLHFKSFFFVNYTNKLHSSDFFFEEECCVVEQRQKNLCNARKSELNAPFVLSLCLWKR